MSTPFPHGPAPRRSFLYRHRKGLVTAALVLGTAVGAGWKAVSEARAERPVIIEVPAADVVGLRQDIGYLRGDLQGMREEIRDARGEIRDERQAREELSKQAERLSTRLSKLEARK